ncbi:hypothetical protein Vretimale_5814 [Volvox reticuliferus]|uniref:Uncharacterized protein n=1 Tax=Volvox reticuliferus TaxID=1737510 RepID=A0A8J4FIX8_9CHLO|nr:hypothetical protein Vretifemale_5713 [Volvox reticuliferus]GIM00925.1 hypothetical protein Vretimale_5814 [Volvox reticuliferus]
MQGAVLGPIGPSGSPNNDAKARPQANLQDLATAAAGLSAESGSSDSCGACIGTPRSLLTTGITPSLTSGAAAAAPGPNAALSGHEREPSSSHAEPPHARTRGPRGCSDVLSAVESKFNMDWQRNPLRAAATAGAGPPGAASMPSHIDTASMLQQLQMLAARGIICGRDDGDAEGDKVGKDIGSAAAAAIADQRDSPDVAAARLRGCNLDGSYASSLRLRNQPNGEPQSPDDFGGYDMPMYVHGEVNAAAAVAAAAVAVDNVRGGDDFRAGPGRRPRKRSAAADSEEAPLDRYSARGEGFQGYELPQRTGPAVFAGDTAAPPTQHQHVSTDSGAYDASAAARRDAAGCEGEGGVDADGGGVPGATDGGGSFLASELPPPVEVTVAVRIGSGRGGEEDARHGNSSYAKGLVCGVFEPSLYMNRMDCIRYRGHFISRSHFEKIGGSSMAKWYRSIRVLPDLEPLGEWLERHGMPVTKGPARRYRPRKQQGGASSGGGGTVGGGGGGAAPPGAAGANVADGVVEMSGGGAGEVEPALPPKYRAGTGEVCSSSCGAGGGEGSGGGSGRGGSQRQKRQPGGPQGTALSLQQQHQTIITTGIQGGVVTRPPQIGETGLGAILDVKLEGEKMESGPGRPGLEMSSPATAAAGGEPSEDEAEGTAALISLSMQGANGGPAAATAAARSLRGVSAAAGNGVAGGEAHSPKVLLQQRQQQPLPPLPPRQGRLKLMPGSLHYQGGVAAGNALGDYDVVEGEGLDRTATERQSGELGGAGDYQRQICGAPRAGGGLLRDGSTGRIAPQHNSAVSALGHKDVAAALVAAAATRAEAAAAGAPQQLSLGVSSATAGVAPAATRRRGLVGKVESGDVEVVDHGGPRDSRYVHEGAHGTEKDDDDVDAYGRYSVRSWQRSDAAATRGVVADGQDLPATAARRITASRLHVGPSSLGGDSLPMAEASYLAAAAAAAAAARGSVVSSQFTDGVPGRTRGVAAVQQQHVGDAAGVWLSDGLGMRHDDADDTDAEDEEQLQAYLVSVGAPALLRSIQLEQRELLNRWRRLDRMRRRLETLHYQPRAGAVKVETAVGRRAPAYDALLQHTAAAAAAAALDECPGSSRGRGGGDAAAKRPRGEVAPGGINGHRMLEEDISHGGHGVTHILYEESGGGGGLGGLHPSRLAEMYASLAGGDAGGVHVGRGQLKEDAQPLSSLVRIVHRGQPVARGGEARELVLGAEEDEAYGLYRGHSRGRAVVCEELLPGPRLSPAAMAAMRQQVWQRSQVRVEVPPPNWSRQHLRAGGGGSGAGAVSHAHELRAAAQYAVHIGGGTRGGGCAAADAAYGSPKRGDELVDRDALAHDVNGNWR